MTSDSLAPATSADAIAEQVRSAKGPLRIAGGNTRQVGTSSGDLLSVAALTGITLYEPGAMTMVARAGTTVSEINQTLAAEGQRLAFEPADWRGLLLCGSWGTLGVLTELSFKVAAVPEAEVTLVKEGLNDEAAVAKLCEAMGTPYDLSASAHIATDNSTKTCVRIEGLEASVMYRRDALLEDVCAGFEVLEGDASAALWTSIRDVTPFAQSDGAVWRASVKPTDAPVLTGKLSDAGITHQTIYDWSGGLVWLLIQSEQSTAASVIRDSVSTLKGHATLIRTAPSLESVPTFQPQASIIQNIEAGLRRQFDPRGVLNPGLMD